jgi:hypothetical protein
MPPVARFYSPVAETLDWTAPVVSAPKPLLRAYEATIEDVSKTDRSIVAKINTGDVDRYRTVISPEGIDLSSYRKNPCVLWEHGKDPQRGSLPIGRNQWIKPGGGNNGTLVAKTLFGKDDYSQALFDMYQDGTLRGWSVNILPDNKRCSPPTKEEMRARPELAECSMMYRYGELAEYSGVAVPGNAETLSILAERGIWCPRATESQGMAAGGAVVVPGTPDSDALPRKKGKKRKKQPSTQTSDVALTGPVENPVPGRTLRYIKHEGNKWNVYSESGKKLGSHDSESDAKKQLSAIEANKGRSINLCDGIYTVRIGSQVILGTSNRSIAEATIEAMDSPIKPWEDEYMRLLSYQRAWQAEMEKNAKALLDMLQTGRV